jgi:hypothetical protein
MDVWQEAAGTLQRQRDVSCDACGYNRRGLPAGARCPECGEPPPAIISVPVIVADLRTAAELRWARCVTAGLVLLGISSLVAMVVATVIPAGPQSIGAINVPCPKLWATALVQRPISGTPGPWGVAGTVAVLSGLVGLWLVTEPRTLRGASTEPFAGLRAAARWCGVLGAGGLFGAFLTTGALWRGGDELGLAVLIALALVELPGTTLLYLYLHRIAVDLDAAHARVALERCAWLIPSVLVAATVVTAGQQFLTRADVAIGASPALGFYAAFGAASLAAGVMATAAYVRLTAAALHRSAGLWFSSVPAAAPGGFRAAAAWFRRITSRDRSRLRVAIGVVVWVWLSLASLPGLLLTDTRAGFGGNLPLVNWLGPKVSAIPLLMEQRTSYYTFRPAGVASVVPLLVTIWLMTSWRFAARERLAAFAGSLLRYGAAALLGAVIAFVMIVHTHQAADNPWVVRRTWSRPATMAVAFIDVPLTLLAYAHLSRIAEAIWQARLAATLRRIGWFGAAAQVIPLAFLAAARGMRTWRGSTVELSLAAAYSAGAMILTLLALAALASLAWGLVAGNQKGTQARVGRACVRID